MTASDFWDSLNEKLQDEATTSEVQFCLLQGLGNRYDGARDKGARAMVIDEAFSTISNLRIASALTGEAALGQVQDEEAVDLDSDGRWSLLRDLFLAYQSTRDSQERTWEPLSVRSVLRVTAFPKSSHEVQIQFDNRLAFSTLVGSLRQLWPDLRRRGWIRQTRPLGERALALVRFVCLEAGTGRTWRARLEDWNGRFINEPSWQFSSARTFSTEFYRSEKQLTGERGGLSWFYDATARQLYEGGLMEAAQLLQTGNAHQRRLAQQLVRDALTGLGSALQAVTTSDEQDGEAR